MTKSARLSVVLLRLNFLKNGLKSQASVRSNNQLNLQLHALQRQTWCGGVTLYHYQIKCNIVDENRAVGPEPITFTSSTAQWQLVVLLQYCNNISRPAMFVAMLSAPHPAQM